MDRRDFLNRLGGAALAAGAVQLAPPKLHAVKDKLTLAAAGDLIIARKVSRRKEAAFLDLVELMRSADCAWGNCEISFLDISRAYPGPKGIDMHVTCDPWGADELAWFGFDFLGCANNHALDYGYDGMFSTIKNLERVGIAYSGAGKNLEEASRPGYADTPAGRLGQVCCSSSALPDFAAEFSSPYTNGRPGINRLGVLTEIELDAASFDSLRDIQKNVMRAMAGRSYEAIGRMTRTPTKKKADPTAPRKQRLNFSGMRFYKGEEIDVESEAHPDDLDRISKALAIAKRNSRVVIQSIHAHEMHTNVEIAAPFLRPFARACIDAGADVFFGTGPHLLRGIEIYKGKPIFYSLGNFFFQYGAVKQVAYGTLKSMGLDGDTLDPSLFYARYDRFFSSKKFWESVVPYITFENGAVTEIKLYPIELGAAEPSYQRGTPMLAGKEAGREIIERLAVLSEPYDTQISFKDGVGQVELAPI